MGYNDSQLTSVKEMNNFAPTERTGMANDKTIELGLRGWVIPIGSLLGSTGYTGSV